jgi:putative ABC transport system permease protein
VALPISYNLRNLLVRRTATALTALGIAAVVAVFVCVLALAEGFRAALAGTGRADRVLVVRKGSDSEIASAIDRGAYNLLRALPGVRAAASGGPLAEGDMVIVVNLERRTEGTTNVTVRGLSGAYRELRGEVAMREGRWFAPGSTEVVVGAALSERVKGCRVGDAIAAAGRSWTVVGIFEAGGGAFESEVWGDADVMLGAFQRRVLQSVTLGLEEGADLEALRARFASDPRLETFEIEREDRYYEKRSATLSGLLRTFGAFISIVMAIGAALGATNTMYAAVAARRREIGTLLAIGFGPTSIFLAFLAEALLLALLGSLLGCVLALPADGVATGTSDQFREVAFRFRITPALLRDAIGFGLAMGAAGGALPAIRAARVPAVVAMSRA